MNKYLNPANYAHRAFSIVNRHLLGHFESVMAPDPDKPLRHPPIFLVGVPRSGSTLAVQAITDALDLGYISKRYCQWFGAPALAEKLFHPTRDKHTSDHRSRQGVTDGWHDSAECGEFW